MKLLMFDTDDFWYRIHSKTWENAQPSDSEREYEPGLVIFIQVEAEDENNPVRVLKKASDNISWLAKKTGRNQILLHSFAHLSESRSHIDIAEQIFQDLQVRLTNKGYNVEITPFGYFLEFKVHVRGESLAKVWRTI